MATLPGEKDFACVEGAALTAGNIIFALFMSLLSGIIIASLVSLHYKKHATTKEVELGTLSGIGAIFGMLTVFCTFCSFPIISLFGLSFAVSLFTDYNLLFKGISLALLLGSLYLIHRQLEGNCGCDK